MVRTYNERGVRFISQEEDDRGVDLPYDKEYQRGTPFPRGLVCSCLRLAVMDGIYHCVRCGERVDAIIYPRDECGYCPRENSCDVFYKNCHKVPCARKIETEEA